LGLLTGVYLIFLIAFIVLFHELAHSFMAIELGYEVEEIKLFGLGGMAFIADLENPTPKEELLISISGPASNFILGISGFCFNVFLSLLGVEHSIEVMVLLFWIVNLSMAIFNMIPIFPLDGGRVFRAIVSFFIDKYTATKYITITSMICSVLVMWIAIYYMQLTLLLVCIFCIIVSVQELQRNKIQNNKKKLEKYFRNSKLL
jgi:stage IV sporulation protein FB